MEEKAPVHLLLLVWNRLEYTQRTLESVLRCTKHPFRLHVVDNASDPPTADFLKRWTEEHPEVVESFVRSEVNEGLSPPTRRFWAQMKARKELWWGKIDNDIIFPEGWLGRLVEVLEKCPSVCVASVCHYSVDFEREVQASPEVILEEGGVRFFPRSHVGGCGYLIRGSACFRVGLLDSRYGKLFGWTRFQERLNQHGFITAYAYPLIPVQHLGEWANQAIQTREYLDYNEKIWEMRHGKRVK